MRFVARQYLPTQHYGAVEHRILRQNPGLAAPILAPDELSDAAFASALWGLTEALGNLTHQLDLDRPVYWCVTRSRSVNAMVARYTDPDMYCVVVGIGAINAITWFSLAAMESDALASFLQENTDPVDSMATPARSRRDAWRQLAGNVEEARLPTTVARAAPLMFLACHFLMAHEINHIAGGHLDLYSGAFTAEAGSDNRLDRAVSRTLERDADALAAAATLYLLGHPEFLDQWAEVFVGHDATRDASMRRFFTASYILFSIMDLLGPEDALGQDRTHPPALVRISTMGVMLTLNLEAFGTISADDAFGIAQRALRAVEIAVFDLAGGIMPEEQALALQGEVQRNLEEHSATWRVMSGRLDRRHLLHYAWSAHLR